MLLRIWVKIKIALAEKRLLTFGPAIDMLVYFCYLSRLVYLNWHEIEYHLSKGQLIRVGWCVY